MSHEIIQFWLADGGFRLILRLSFDILRQAQDKAQDKAQDGAQDRLLSLRSAELTTKPARGERIGILNPPCALYKRGIGHSTLCPYVEERDSSPRLRMTSERGD